MAVSRAGTPSACTSFPPIFSSLTVRGAPSRLILAGGKICLFELEQKGEFVPELHDIPPHLALLHLPVEVAHVHGDEQGGFLRERAGRFEAGEDLPCDAFSLFGVRMILSVAEHAEGLSDVMQKRRPADAGSGVLDAAEGVFEDVEVMEIFALLHAFSKGKLGHGMP